MAPFVFPWVNSPIPILDAIGHNTEPSKPPVNLLGGSANVFWEPRSSTSPFTGTTCSPARCCSAPCNSPFCSASTGCVAYGGPGTFVSIDFGTPIAFIDGTLYGVSPTQYLPEAAHADLTFVHTSAGGTRTITLRGTRIGFGTTLPSPLQRPINLTGEDAAVPIIATSVDFSFRDQLPALLSTFAPIGTHTMAASIALKYAQGPVALIDTIIPPALAVGPILPLFVQSVGVHSGDAVVLCQNADCTLCSAASTAPFATPYATGPPEIMTGYEAYKLALAPRDLTPSTYHFCFAPGARTWAGAPTAPIPAEPRKSMRVISVGGVQDGLVAPFGGAAVLRVGPTDGVEATDEFFLEAVVPSAFASSIAAHVASGRGGYPLPSSGPLPCSRAPTASAVPVPDGVGFWTVTIPPPKTDAHDGVGPCAVRVCWNATKLRGVVGAINPTPLYLPPAAVPVLCGGGSDTTSDPFGLPFVGIARTLVAGLVDASGSAVAFREFAYIPFGRSDTLRFAVVWPSLAALQSTRPPRVSLVPIPYTGWTFANWATHPIRAADCRTSHLHDLHMTTTTVRASVRDARSSRPGVTTREVDALMTAAVSFCFDPLQSCHEPFALTYGVYGVCVDYGDGIGPIVAKHMLVQVGTTPTATPSHTRSHTPSHTRTRSHTRTPAHTRTSTPTVTYTPIPTVTPARTDSASTTPTHTATDTPAFSISVRLSEFVCGPADCLANASADDPSSTVTVARCLESTRVVAAARVVCVLVVRAPNGAIVTDGALSTLTFRASVALDVGPEVPAVASMVISPSSPFVCVPAANASFGRPLDGAPTCPAGQVAQLRVRRRWFMTPMVAGRYYIKLDVNSSVAAGTKTSRFVVRVGPAVAVVRACALSTPPLPSFIVTPRPYPFATATPTYDPLSLPSLDPPPTSGHAVILTNDDIVDIPEVAHAAAATFDAWVAAAKDAAGVYGGYTRVPVGTALRCGAQLRDSGGNPVSLLAHGVITFTVSGDAVSAGVVDADALPYSANGLTIVTAVDVPAGLIPTVATSQNIVSGGLTMTVAAVAVIPSGPTGTAVWEAAVVGGAINTTMSSYSCQTAPGETVVVITPDVQAVCQFALRDKFGNAAAVTNATAQRVTPEQAILAATAFGIGPDLATSLQVGHHPLLAFLAALATDGWSAQLIRGPAWPLRRNAGGTALGTPATVPLPIRRLGLPVANGGVPGGAAFVSPADTLVLNMTRLVAPSPAAAADAKGVPITRVDRVSPATTAPPLRWTSGAPSVLRTLVACAPVARAAAPLNASSVIALRASHVAVVAGAPSPLSAAAADDDIVAMYAPPSGGGTAAGQWPPASPTLMMVPGSHLTCWVAPRDKGGNPPTRLSTGALVGAVPISEITAAPLVVTSNVPLRPDQLPLVRVSRDAIRIAPDGTVEVPLTGPVFALLDPTDIPPPQFTGTPLHTDTPTYAATATRTVTLTAARTASPLPWMPTGPSKVPTYFYPNLNPVPVGLLPPPYAAVPDLFGTATKKVNTDALAWRYSVNHGGAVASRLAVSDIITPALPSGVPPVTRTSFATQWPVAIQVALGIRNTDVSTTGRVLVAPTAAVPSASRSALACVNADVPDATLLAVPEAITLSQLSLPMIPATGAIAGQLTVDHPAICILALADSASRPAALPDGAAAVGDLIAPLGVLANTTVTTAIIDRTSGAVVEIVNVSTVHRGSAWVRTGALAAAAQEAAATLGFNFVLPPSRLFEVAAAPAGSTVDSNYRAPVGNLPPMAAAAAAVPAPYASARSAPSGVSLYVFEVTPARAGVHAIELDVYGIDVGGGVDLGADRPLVIGGTQVVEVDAPAGTAPARARLRTMVNVVPPPIYVAPPALASNYDSRRQLVVLICAIIIVIVAIILLVCVIAVCCARAAPKQEPPPVESPPMEEPEAVSESSLGAPDHPVDQDEEEESEEDEEDETPKALPVAPPMVAPPPLVDDDDDAFAGRGYDELGPAFVAVPCQVLVYPDAMEGLSVGQVQLQHTAGTAGSIIPTPAGTTLLPESSVVLTQGAEVLLGHLPANSAGNSNILGGDSVRYVDQGDDFSFAGPGPAAAATTSSGTMRYVDDTDEFSPAGPSV